MECMECARANRLSLAYNIRWCKYYSSCKNGPMMGYRVIGNEKIPCLKRTYFKPLERKLGDGSVLDAKTP